MKLDRDTTNEDGHSLSNLLNTPHPMPLLSLEFRVSDGSQLSDPSCFSSGLSDEENSVPTVDPRIYERGYTMLYFYQLFF